MGTRVRQELTYDAPLADVAAMLADEAFREQVCRDIGVIRSSVTIQESDGTTEVTIEQVQPAQGIPSFAKKFVGDEITIVQRESWSSPDAADIHVTIPGKPGEMTGTARLAEAGGVTTETVDMEVKVGIPLVGGRIEKLIGDMLSRALAAENAAGRRYLAG